MRACILYCTAAALALAGLVAAPAQPVSDVSGVVDATQSYFEVYQLPFSEPKATEAMAKAIVGADGSVIYDAQNRRLLVAAPRKKHQELKAMIEKLNVIPHNVRIEVEFKNAGSSEESEASVTAAGDVTIEDGLANTKIKIKPTLVNESITSSSSTKQTLLVASGHEGTLNVGQNVPYLEWLTTYGGATLGTVNWQQVGSRLVVEPFVIDQGPLIRVRVTPELSGMVDGKPFHTRFAAAATEIVVKDGEPFSIGGMNGDSTFYSRFLVGRASGSGQEQVDIVLTPHIMDMKGP
jgi:hypothetical protein